MPKKNRTACLSCGGLPARPMYVYCSNKCQANHKYNTYIQQWLKGEEKGLQRLGVVSRHIKRFLRNKYENKCCLCGWAKVNPITKQIPLVADHIDGDWRNNTVDNLRLICPNCDSLSPTFAGSNRGKGRTGRVVSNRVKEARELLAQDFLIE